MRIGTVQRFFKKSSRVCFPVRFAFQAQIKVEPYLLLGA